MDCCRTGCRGRVYSMGRDSPGALLDMLAEVASQTLHSEKTQTELIATKSKLKMEPAKRKTQETSFDATQLLSMPATQLVKQFSIYSSDELKRQYSYTCALVPGCGQRYTSFASEGRARMSIKAHLAEHLEYLKTNEEAHATFNATSVKYRNPKTSLQNKKMRIQQVKKPQEALNKENKDVKSEKSTNYLRKILSNEMNFKEFEKHRALAKVAKSKDQLMLEEKRKKDEIDQRVLGDHSYYEHVKTEASIENGTADLANVIKDEIIEENIMLMVVESDGVHMKELPYIAQNLTNHKNQQDSETVYLPESVSWSEQGYSRSMEIATSAKPRGKAKFIGTSAEEREMALALIERIKKKGNPTGSNLQCRICDPPRSFTAPTTLVSHYRSHAGIKPYECRICHAVFTRRHSLKYHMLIHQNQTRFTCTDCGKKFRHPSHFREHRRRHTGEAPFGCDDCGQRFKTRNTYKRHLKTRHGKVLTTTGELLCLSEEDFQKVRTNRKRRVVTVPPENMADEDLIAPEAIMQYQSDDTEENRGLFIEESIAMNYETHSEENDVNGNRDVWTTTGLTNVMKVQEDYSNYEIGDESHEHKTDHIETEIAVESSNYETEESEMSQLQYNGLQIDDQEIHEESVNAVNLMEDDESLTAENQILSGQDLKINENGVFYPENSLADNCEDLRYTDDDSQKDTISQGEFQFHEDFASSQNYINEQLDISGQSDDQEAAICEIQSSAHDEVEIGKESGQYSYNSLEDSSNKLQIEYPEIKAERDDMASRYEIHFVPGKSGQYRELEKYLDELQNCNKRLRLVKNEYHSSNFEPLKENNVESVEETTPQQESVKQRQEEGKPLQNNENTLQDLVNENIIEFSTNEIAEGNERIQSEDNIAEHRKESEQSNRVAIQDEELADALSHRQSKIQQTKDPPKLQLSQNGAFALLNEKHAQAIRLIQAGSQGTILLLANDNLKRNLLRVDQVGIVSTE